MSDFEQRRWAHDIQSYERLKCIRAKMNCPDSGAARFCDDRITEIESRYPQYLGRAALAEGGTK